MALIQTTINQLRTGVGLNPADEYYTTDEEQEGFWYADNTGYGTVSNDNTGTAIFNMPGNQLYRRVYDKGFVNVKWFGAKGDGLTDDTIAIQAALDFISKTTNTSTASQAEFGGGTVFLPKGIYLITETLLIGQNCKLTGVNNRYHFEYLFGDHQNPSGAGSLIRANFTNTNQWVISSATYKYDSTDKPKLDLLPYDTTLSEEADVPYSFEDYIYRMGVVIENLTIDGGVNNAFGGIRLANAGNSCVRNVGVNRTKCGIMLNTCWGGSIENCFVNIVWYGALVIDCKSTMILDSYFRGARKPDNYIPIAPNELPNFIYQAQPYTNWGLNDEVKYGRTGIYSFNTSSLSISATVVEEIINGISCLNSTMSLESIHMENISKYAISIGIGDNTQLSLNQFLLWNVEFGFIFGHNIQATLNTINYPIGGEYANQLYYYSSGTNRNITFSKTIYQKRRYYPDIIFTDEGAHGQNTGAVYIDPVNGSDNNYGFNTTDALKTFDAALARVQNQTTLNPIKTIYIKAAPQSSGEVSPKLGAATKNLDIVSLENVDLLITCYDTNSELGAYTGRIYFEGDNSDMNFAMIGQLALGGNVNLYFRNIDLVCNTASAISSNPTNLSMFGLKNSYAKVIFESNRQIRTIPPNPVGNIFLDMTYFLFQADSDITITNPICSMLDSKFVNIAIVGGSGLSSNIFGSPILGVDCVQINSMIPTAYYTLPGNGWQDATIIRNNF